MCAAAPKIKDYIKLVVQMPASTIILKYLCTLCRIAEEITVLKNSFGFFFPKRKLLRRDLNMSQEKKVH